MHAQRLPEDLWIRIGVWADCLPQLELLTREMYRRKPTKMLINRMLVKNWGDAEDLQPAMVRRLWGDLGTYLQDLAQTWEDFTSPRIIPVQRVLYPKPRCRHVVYGLRYLKYKVLRKEGRFLVLALIG